MYIIYGNNVKDGFDIFADYRSVCDRYGKLPQYGKRIRQFPDFATVDVILKYVGPEFDGYEDYVVCFYRRLRAYRNYNGLPTPDKDCAKHPHLLALAKEEDQKAASEKEAEPPSLKLTEGTESLIRDNLSVPDSVEFSLPTNLRLCLPQTVSFYTDGSCFEYMFGGFAAIPLDGGKPLAFLSGAAIVHNSAEAEWRAIHLALQSIPEGNHQVYLYTDSLEVVKNLDNESYHGASVLSAEMQDILREIREICRKNKVSIAHVSGHSGIEWNELADVIARKRAGDLRRKCMNLHATVKTDSTFCDLSSILSNVPS